jgi:S-DNA-T family DNA segregation ATPase FtsK/SpoIIIE
VGPFNGTKAREVLVEDEEELDDLLHSEGTSDADPEDA